MSPRTRRLSAAALATVVLVAGLSMAPANATGTCTSSQPSSRGFTVTVCLTNPGDGTTLAGDATVTATVSVSPPHGVKNVEFKLDGGYVLTDFNAPFTFTLRSIRWADGPHTLSVRARVRASPMFVTAPTSIGLTFTGGGPVSNPPGFAASTGTSPGAGQPFVIAAVGDGADGSLQSQSVVTLVSSIDPNMLLYLGDVYEEGSPSEFLNWYGMTDRWSTFRSITNPTVGNHEYTIGAGAPGYFDYWNQPPHFYSLDVAGWHLISIDANPAPSFGQTDPGTPQYDWLKNDLETSTAACTIVFYHQPLYSVSRGGGNLYLSQIWSLLASHGVDIVLNGHSHNYQRWKPLDAAGNHVPLGTTEFVVGTGGRVLYPITSSDSRVAVAIGGDRGALRLMLQDGSADYTFLSTPSPGTVEDSGTLACSPAQASPAGRPMR